MSVHTLQLRVNGSAHELPVPGNAALLTVLRNDLQLNSPKYGCGLGQCGACLVLVDGVPARSCVIPCGGMQGRHGQRESHQQEELSHRRISATGRVVGRLAPRTRWRCKNCQYARRCLTGATRR